MKKFVFGIAIASLLFSACSKGGDSSSSNKKDMLTSGGWMLTSGNMKITMSGTTVAEEDIYSSMDDCEKDNLLKFKTDMTAWTDEGATKCNSSDPQETKEGNWALSDNNTKLLQITSTDTTTMNIVQLDASTLKLSSTQTETDPSTGMTYTIDMNMSLKNVK